MKISFTLISLALLCMLCLQATAQEFPELKINLSIYNNQGVAELADGNLVLYGDEYSNDIDFYDAPKMTNFGENIAIERQDKIFAVERRQKQFMADTIPFRIWKMRTAKYQFLIRGRYLTLDGRKGYLEDAYLNTKIDLALDGSISSDFSIDNDPASADIHRFRIIITTPKVESVIFTKANGNRKNDGVELIWNVADAKNIRQFQIEKLLSGNNFITAKTIETEDPTKELFSWIDNNVSPELTTYRISSINIDGKVEYSKLIEIAKIERHYTALIFPNPVKGGIININIQDITPGNYSYRIMSNGGQLTQAGQVTLYTQPATIKLLGNIKIGNYVLQVFKNNKTVLNQNIIVQ